MGRWVEVRGKKRAAKAAGDRGSRLARYHGGPSPNAGTTRKPPLLFGALSDP